MRLRLETESDHQQFDHFADGHVYAGTANRDPDGNSDKNTVPNSDNLSDSVHGGAAHR